MKTTRDEAAVIARVNDLLQLDHDAVEAYTVAIDLARNSGLRDRLVEIRAQHKERIERFAAIVRDRGGLPLEIPHVTAGLKIAVQTAGAVAGDAALLLAFKAVEGQIAEKFRDLAHEDSPQEIATQIRDAAALEQSHYDWAEHELKRQGLSASTLPHNAASALEELHKLLANPIERAGRELKQRVGEMIGTRESRGGSDAPSPAAAARGMAQSAATSTGTKTTGGTSMEGTANAAGAQAQKHDVEQFIQALHELEESKRVEPIVAMFDTAAELSNAIAPEPRRGQDGAREFWRVYRESFNDIHSEFRTVVETDGKAMLEWTSRGHKVDGGEFSYSGVSVLELDGGKVKRFRAYFDPTALTAHHE